MALGGVLNIALDPLFIFVFRLNIAGAAIATMLSNVIAMLYFVGFLIYIRKKSVITLNPKLYSVRHKIPAEVIAVGLPGFVMTMMSTISNTALNNMVAGYSNTAITGMGIAKKIDLLAYAIAQGMTPGTLPLIGYNYSSGNQKRMKDAMQAAFAYSLIVAISGTVLLYFFAAPIAGGFISDAETVRLAYSAHCLNCTPILSPLLVMRDLRA